MPCAVASQDGRRPARCPAYPGCRCIDPGLERRSSRSNSISRRDLHHHTGSPTGVGPPTQANVQFSEHTSPYLISLFTGNVSPTPYNSSYDQRLLHPQGVYSASCFFGFHDIRLKINSSTNVETCPRGSCDTTV